MVKNDIIDGAKYYSQVFNSYNKFVMSERMVRNFILEILLL